MAILPGQTTSRVPDGYTCFHTHYDEDDNLVECKEPATRGFCTEADSFGAEIEYFCDEHLRELQEKTPWYQNPESPVCEWHREGQGPIKVETVQPIRDPDEGLHGPVYYACGACRQRMWAAQEQEEIAEGLRCSQCRRWTGTYTGNYCTCCSRCGVKRNPEFKKDLCADCAATCWDCGGKLDSGVCVSKKCEKCGDCGVSSGETLCWHCNLDAELAADEERQLVGE